MERYEVIITGGGPAGLFCANICASSGKKVMILEKMPSCGRKLLISGSGQCNITHAGEVSSFLGHYGEHGRFVKPSLMQYSNRDLIAFFQDHGLAMDTVEGGKVFPGTRKASDILKILLDECTLHGVEIHCNEPVLSAPARNGRFLVTTSKNEYCADTLVIATGGASYPATGSTGDGYTLARAMRHRTTGIRPALAAVLVSDFPFGDLAGMSFEHIPISLYHDGKKVIQHQGDLLFTHTGLSGPGILDISRDIFPGDLVRVSFVTGKEPEQAKSAIIGLLIGGKGIPVAKVMKGLALPERLVKRILDQAGVVSGQTCAHLTKNGRNSLVSLITGYSFPVQALEGFERAMVTRGGVALEEINPRTMESRLIPGLYFSGEVLDIDGDTGGYNLQFACSSGVVAGRGITRRDSDP